MRRKGRLSAALLAGAASAGLQAQPTVTPKTPLQPAPAQAVPGHSQTETAPNQTKPSENGSTPKMEFRGLDGEPLSPEMERYIREQLKNNPPTTPTAEPDPPPLAEDGSILVTGERSRGSVIGDIPPELTFSPVDIRAYGANDIEALIQSLGPRVSSGRGAEDSGPVVLVNGKRVSSFAEIANIPTEAIERMEVFPEEWALKYGYRATQKVVNVVLRERYSSQVGQLTYAVPTEGGRDAAGIDATFLRIRGETRFNFDADYSRSDALLESDRDVVQLSGSSELGRFRTLLPKTERIALNGTISGNVVSGLTSTLNGRYEARESGSLLGIGAHGPRRRDTDISIAHLGTTLGGLAGKWLWTFTGNYDRIGTETFTDTGGQGARDEARSVNSFIDADLVASSSVLKLPAGSVSLSFRGSFDMRDFRSTSLRDGEERRRELSRDRGAAQANLDIPLARRNKQHRLGNLSVNVNAEIEELSDFGTLRTFGYGLYWSPVEEISLIASAAHEEGAPTVEQLGSPLIVTPNIRAFDFIRGETVDITRVFGGNPDLRSENRRVLAVGINAKPFSATDLTLSIDYTSTRIDDPIATFPIATPEIEAACPERFTRDADGRLLRIDSKPLNFERSTQEKLRSGINFTKPLGPQPSGMQSSTVRTYSNQADARASLPPDAVIIMAKPGSPAAHSFENLTSRLILSVYYTWNIQDKILVREGGLAVDLLDGFATGDRGGTPRHELELQAGAFKSGLGARLTAKWQSATTVLGMPASTGGTISDLSFSDYSTVNINLFANLADQFGGTDAPQWLKATRVSIGITNLFNSRPEVRDEAGLTPLNYQPAYLDPIGRVVSLTVRKVF